MLILQLITAKVTMQKVMCIVGWTTFIQHPVLPDVAKLVEKRFKQEQIVQQYWG
jgi:hypothetical protein